MSPYIKQEERSSYLDHIQILRTELKGMPIGHLNFVISSLIKDLGYDYASYNAVIGVLEAVKLEYYRRYVSLYEDVKLKKNGDI